MKTDYAAGGVVIRKNNNKWEVLIIKDKNSIWTFPKGHKENDETDIETAVREIKEETGIGGLKKVADLGKVFYTFQTGGENISKSVRFYLFMADAINDPYPAKSEGISAAMWISEKDIYNKLGYPKTNWPLFEKAKIQRNIKLC